MAEPTDSKAIERYAAGSMKHLRQLFEDILISSKRPQALIDLSFHRTKISRLGLLVYCRQSVIANILLEIVSRFPGAANIAPHPPSHDVVCAAVIVLQQVLFEPEVRTEFIASNITCYLLPFLNDNSRTSEAEQIRTTVLGMFVTATYKLTHDQLDIHVLHLGDPSSSKIGHKAVENWPDYTSGLFELTVKCIVRSTSDVGRSIGLLLVANLLGSPRLREYILLHPSVFTQMCSALNLAVSHVATELNDQPGSYKSSQVIGANNCSHGELLLRMKQMVKYVTHAYSLLANDRRMNQIVKSYFPPLLTTRIFIDGFDRDLEIVRSMQSLWKCMDIPFKPE